MNEFSITKADLLSQLHASAVLALLDAYSSDPNGDAKPLSDYARAHLINGLREHPTSLVFLVFLGDTPCGLAICFQGFSTFAAKPLINIHDLFVDPIARGRGVARLLLNAVECEARRLDCCKLTLEVLSSNDRATAIYVEFGFAEPSYGGKPIETRFLTKNITQC